MKKIIILSLFTLLCSRTNAQDFKLSFIEIDKFLTQKYSLAKIEPALKPYMILKKNNNEWKFRDENKSWEATLYVQFDATTKLIKEIQFAAPEIRVYDYMDELEKTLGFVHIATEGQMDVYENSKKQLGAKLVKADFLGKGMMLYRMYRL